VQLVQEYYTKEPVIEAVQIGHKDDGSEFTWQDMIDVAEWCYGKATRDTSHPEQSEKKQYWHIFLNGDWRQEARMSWWIVHFKSSGLFKAMSDAEFKDTYQKGCEF